MKRKSKSIMNSDNRSTKLSRIPIINNSEKHGSIKRITPKKKILEGIREEHHFIWVLGLSLFFLTLLVFKAGGLVKNELYLLAILSSMGIFYIGAILAVKNPYKRGKSYLKESLNYIYLVVFLFIAFTLSGLFFSENLRFLDNILIQLITKTQGLNAFELIDFIFFNNLEVAFFGLFLGVFLVIFPFVNAVANGIVLGYVFSKLAEVSRLGDFWRILPHGIFELPAIFISLALGIKLGMFIFAERKLFELGRHLRESIIVFTFYVTPLLIIAAVIEGILISFF